MTMRAVPTPSATARRPRRFVSWPRIHALSLATVALVFAAPGTARAAQLEVHARGGLPEFRAEAEGGHALRIAYLGGSITAAANGWRTLTTEHLRARFPQSTILEINAGLPGTGSDLGACRVGHDVLGQRPTLLFVEFAVNDAGTSAGRIERTMEGIVRQTRRTSPRTDIVFVYTVSAPGLSELEAGRLPLAVQAMERVAEHYGIASVNFGLEVTEQVKAGALVFKAPAADADAKTFSLDGVHPTAVGHRIYAAVLERSLPRLLETGANRPAALPPPLHADNWEGAGLQQLDRAALEGKWDPVASDDPQLRGATKQHLPPTWRTAQPGAAVVFEFTGRTFGLLGVASPDSGRFRVIVDDLKPVADTFFDAFVTPTFCRQRPWFYPRELADGPHRVRVELDAAPLDKVAIKAAAGKPLQDPEPYAAQRLTLSALLTVSRPGP